MAETGNTLGSEDGCGALEALVDAARLSRRAVLAGGLGAAVAACAHTEKWDVRSVPLTEDGKLAELETSEHPELATPGGMIAVRPRGSRRTVLVMRIEGGQFRVLSLRCTHLGCTVRWDNEAQALACPCHGSQFEDDGRVKKGPAKSALPQLESGLVGTILQFRVP